MAGYRDRKMAILLGAGVFLLYLAFMRTHIGHIDGYSMLFVTRSLVLHQDFTVPPESTLARGILGREGNSYSPWYPLLSVVTVPFYSIGEQLVLLTHSPTHEITFFFVLLVPMAFMAATGALVALLALRLGSSRRGAIIAALCFAFGTIALEYARLFFAGPLLSFLTILAIYLAFDTTPMTRNLSAIPAGLAILTKPVGIIVGPILSLYLLAKTRSLRAASWPTIGTMLGGYGYTLYNYMRFGDPFNFGGDGEINLHPPLIAESILGMLFSPGNGLIWFCPAVVIIAIALQQRKIISPGPLPARPDVLTIIAIFCGYLFIHTFIQRPLGNWHSGCSWGPRFLLPGLPPLFALAAFLQRKWKHALIASGILGFLINTPMLISNQVRYCIELGFQGIGFRDIVWDVQNSPFIAIWDVAYNQMVEALQGNLAVLEWRWLQLPFPEVPFWLGPAIAVFLLGAGITLLSFVWRRWQASF